MLFKNIIKTSVALVALGALVPAAFSAPITFLGKDQGSSTVNADTAYADWQAAVGSFTLDNLDGMTAGGFGATVTTALGNTLSSTDDLIGPQNITFAVLDGISLRATKQGAVTDLVWNIAEAVDSFGFFARNNDGGLITISLLDGSMDTFTFTAESTVSSGDNFFWGITNLPSAVTSIAITSTEGPTNFNSNWDRFVYRPASTTAVPANSVGIAIAAMIGVCFFRRRKA